jgi:hypothetical protein
MIHDSINSDLSGAVSVKWWRLCPGRGFFWCHVRTGSNRSNGATEGEIGLEDFSQLGRPGFSVPWSVVDFRLSILTKVVLPLDRPGVGGFGTSPLVSGSACENPRSIVGLVTLIKEAENVVSVPD